MAAGRVGGLSLGGSHVADLPFPVLHRKGTDGTRVRRVPSAVILGPVSPC